MLSHSDIALLFLLDLENTAMIDESCALSTLVIKAGGIDTVRTGMPLPATICSAVNAFFATKASRQPAHSSIFSWLNCRGDFIGLSTTQRVEDEGEDG